MTTTRRAPTSRRRHGRGPDPVRQGTARQHRTAEGRRIDGRALPRLALRGRRRRRQRRGHAGALGGTDRSDDSGSRNVLRRRSPPESRATQARRSARWVDHDGRLRGRRRDLRDPRDESVEQPRGRARQPTRRRAPRSTATRASRTTYSILADSLTAAAISSAASRSIRRCRLGSDRSKRGSAGATRVSLGPGSARFEMTF